MKKLFLYTAFLFLFAANGIAQEVIASAGETQTISGYEVSWILGEPAIETIAPVSFSIVSL